MNKHLSLRKTSVILFIALLATAALFGLGTMHFLKKVEEINLAWLSFKSQHAEKARLETSLRATLGYGGMIHDFKNYILRKDFDRLVQLQKSLGAAQTIVSQYRAISTTQAEKIVLEDIQEMLENYQQGTELARDEIKKGKKSSEIDSLVRINDEFALRGLKILREEIIAEHQYYSDKKQKSVLAASIRSELGYGGMIHSFKNYVLRQDNKYYEKVQGSIDKTLSLIDSYKRADATLGERTALEDIKNTLQQYRKNLAVVKNKIKNGASPEAIDEAVKINDKYALRGLKTLDHDIILQIEEKSAGLSGKIIDLTETERMFTYAVTTIMLCLALFLIWTFSQKIILPIKNISAAMIGLAEGNLDTDLPHPDKSTELGRMAGALHIFKEHEHKRREAEEEILRMAMTDPLTGLANRNQFVQRYNEMEAIAKREARILAFLALDLDKFKPINDNYGHAAGDEVLKSVAKNLLLAFRETDLVARLGGDEFAVILFGPENIETVTYAARRVIDLMSEPILVNGKKLTVGTSIGIEIYQPSNEIKDLDSIMQNADSALYEAKEAGRNTYRVFEADNNQENISLIHNATPD